MTAKTIIKDQWRLMQKANDADQNDLVVGKDLLDTLLANRERAAGLAANMIGVNKRVITFYAGPLAIVMYNPEIVAKSGSYQTEEGCLSLVGTRPTTRYETIVVKYQDQNFERKTQEFTGFIAEVIQHEIDHCQGILI